MAHFIDINDAHLPRSSVTNTCTNGPGANGAWPDLLRVAAMNRHCVSCGHVAEKTAELCVFSPAHVRAKGKEGDLTPPSLSLSLLLKRDCQNAGEGVRREKNIRHDLSEGTRRRR